MRGSDYGSEGGGLPKYEFNTGNRRGPAVQGDYVTRERDDPLTATILSIELVLPE